MTPAAAAIEIGVSASPIGAGATPSAGFGKASGLGRAGAASHGLQTAAASETQSFRSGWQALLASLGSGMGSSEADSSEDGKQAVSDSVSVATAQNTVSEPAAKSAAGRSTEATSNLFSNTVLQWGQGSGKADYEEPSPPIVQAGALPTRPADGDTRPAAAKQPAAAKSEERKAALETGSLSSPQLAHLIQVAQPEANGAGAMPAIAATAVNLPQDVSAPTTSGPIIYSYSGKELTLPVLADPSSDNFRQSVLHSGTALDSQSRQLSALRVSGRVTGGVAGTETMATPLKASDNETSTIRNTPSYALSDPDSSGPAINATELPDEQQHIGPAAAMLTDSEKPMDASEWSSDSTPLVAHDQKSSTPFDGLNQSAVQRVALAIDPIQAVAQSSDLAQNLTEDQNLAQQLPYHASPVHVAEVKENSTQIDPIQAVAQSSDLVQNLTEDQNLAQPSPYHASPVHFAEVKENATQIDPIQAVAQSSDLVQNLTEDKNLAQPSPYHASPVHFAEVKENATQIDPIHAVAQSSDLVQNLTEDKNLAQPSPYHASPVHVAGVKENATQAAAQTVNTVEIVALTKNNVSPPPPDTNPARAASSGERATQSLLFGQNQTQPVKTDSIRDQAVVSSQYPISATVASQSELPGLPEKTETKLLSALPGVDGVNPLQSVVNAASASSALPSPPLLSAGKSGSTSGGQNITSDLARSARETGSREAGNSGALQPAAAHAQVHVSALTTNVVAATGDLSGAVVAVGDAGSKTTPIVGPDTREAFATMDAQSATASPAWIHAGRQQAEAGFQDPTLGWVGVRADANGGGVHAEVMAGSAEAAQALGSQMAGLNAYLAEHHSPVETVTLSAPDGAAAGFLSAGENMQHGAGQQSGQEAAQSMEGGLLSGSAAEGTIFTAVAPVSWSGGLDGGASRAEVVGGHISVMA